MNVRVLFGMMMAGAVGCGTAAENASDLCGADDVFALAGANYCVVIEEGFLEADCPDDFPFGRDFDGVIVCGEEEPPDEARDELVERGLLDPVCEDDPATGRHYVAVGAACDVVDLSCGDEEEPFRDDCGCGCQTVGECEEGATRTEDCNTCSCVGGMWACTGLACECSAGQTQPYRCDTECTCASGTWDCPDVTCPLEECLAECGDGCPAPEFQPCGADGELYCNECEMSCHGVEPAADRSVCSSLETCLEECGVGCPAPEFQLCGVDGELYCTDCTMACYGVELASDATLCDDRRDCEAGDLYDGPCGPQFSCVDGAWVGPETCEPYDCGMDCLEAGGSVCGENGNIYVTDCWRRCYGVPVADSSDVCEPDIGICDISDSLPTEIDWALVELPDTCSPPMDSFEEVRIVTDETALLAAFECWEGTVTGIDWDTQRVAVVSYFQRTTMTVMGAYDEAGRIRIQLAAEAYCGGAAPPTALAAVAIPAGDAEVFTTPCGYGSCPIGPPVP
ncbi:MAG: hypothetical protein H6700_02690 [Myxococcales bacterium]|nr:hypothetical protein [Myxococcales bacterium]MCB9530647.1 hypothetical protein [Myxococcales bacterium]